MKRVLHIGVLSIIGVGFTLAGIPAQAAPPTHFLAASSSTGARYQLASWRGGDDQDRGYQRGRNYDRDRESGRDRDRNQGYGDSGYYAGHGRGDDRSYRNDYYVRRYDDGGYYDRDRHVGRSTAIIGGGAAAGAVIGAAAGHGQGAAIGAVVGGIAGILADQAVRHHDRR